jgi:hypothetical protein
MSYKKALEVLKNYKPQQLIALDYNCRGHYCIMGLLIPSTTQYSPAPYKDYDIRTLINIDVNVADELRLLNMTIEEAVALQEYGDEDHKETRHMRYNRVLKWLEAKCSN